MVRDITLGQYFPGKSFIHRLDPRVKIILTFVYIIFIFVANNFYGLLLVVALVLGTLLLSGVPFSQYLKSLKAIMLVVIFSSEPVLRFGAAGLAAWLCYHPAGRYYQLYFYRNPHYQPDFVQFGSHVYHLTDRADRCSGTHHEAAENLPVYPCA